MQRNAMLMYTSCGWFFDCLSGIETIQIMQYAQRAMQLADIGFLSLIPNVYRYAYPSKTMNYLQQGLPVLALIEEESQLSSELSEFQAGISVSNANTALLSEKITLLVDDPKRLKEMRLNAKALYEHRFSQKRILPLWSGLLSQ